MDEKAGTGIRSRGRGGVEASRGLGFGEGAGMEEGAQ